MCSHGFWCNSTWHVLETCLTASPHKLTSACSCLSDGLAFPLISVATRIWSVCRYQFPSDTMFNNFQAVIVCCWKPRIFSHNTLTEMYNTDVSPPPPHSSDSKFSFYFMLHLLLPLVFILVSTGLLLFLNEIRKCLRLFHCVLVLYFWNTSLVDLWQHSSTLCVLCWLFLTS